MNDLGVHRIGKYYFPWVAVDDYFITIEDDMDTWGFDKFGELTPSGLYGRCKTTSKKVAYERLVRYEAHRRRSQHRARF